MQPLNTINNKMLSSSRTVSASLCGLSGRTCIVTKKVAHSQILRPELTNLTFANLFWPCQPTW